MTNLVLKCLSKLSLFQCKDDLQFLATIRQIRESLVQTYFESEESSDEIFRLIAIDRMETHFWLHKLMAEAGSQVRLQIQQELQQLIQKQHLICFCTTGSLFPRISKYRRTQQQTSSDILGRQWGMMLKYSVVCARHRLGTFHSTTSKGKYRDPVFVAEIQNCGGEVLNKFQFTVSDHLTFF